LKVGITNKYPKYYGVKRRNKPRKYEGRNGGSGGGSSCNIEGGRAGKNVRTNDWQNDWMRGRRIIGWCKENGDM